MREIRTSGLMSGEGRRGWPKGPLPRPSSTLPRLILPWILIMAPSYFFVLFGTALLGSDTQL